jgi:hypothetical protein
MSDTTNTDTVHSAHVLRFDDVHAICFDLESSLKKKDAASTEPVSEWSVSNEDALFWGGDDQSDVLPPPPPHNYSPQGTQFQAVDFKVAITLPWNLAPEAMAVLANAMRSAFPGRHVSISHSPSCVVQLPDLHQQHYQQRW